jgi:hypothetical protein
VGLIARVRALGRRAALPVPPMLYHGDIRLDPGSRAAFRAGRRLPLSAKEFAVLEHLPRHPGGLPDPPVGAGQSRSNVKSLPPSDWSSTTMHTSTSGSVCASALSSASRTHRVRTG